MYDAHVKNGLYIVLTFTNITEERLFYALGLSLSYDIVQLTDPGVV